MALRPRTLDARRGRRMAIYIRNSEDQEEITRHNFHVEDSSNPSSPTSHFIQSEELSSFQGEQQLLEKEKGTGCDHSSDCTKVGSGHTSSFGHTLGCSSPSVENEDTHEEECQATASASTSTIPIRIDPQVLEELAEARYQAQEVVELYGGTTRNIPCNREDCTNILVSPAALAYHIHIHNMARDKSHYSRSVRLTRTRVPTREHRFGTLRKRQQEPPSSTKSGPSLSRTSLLWTNSSRNNLLSAQELTSTNASASNF
ncbi:hypothetical protein ABKN59_008662 [Abortiporus biennis]